MECTFAMLKPGVIQRRIAGEILARIEKKGLTICGLKLMNVTPGFAARHYAEHVGKPFYEELVAFITSGPVVAMAIGGDDAVSILRRLCGATKVEEAVPGTIRGDYADHTCKNIIHASDSKVSAERELALFFAPEELVTWKDGNDVWI